MTFVVHSEGTRFEILNAQKLKDWKAKNLECSKAQMLDIRLLIVSWLISTPSLCIALFSKTFEPFFCL